VNDRGTKTENPGGGSHGEDPSQTGSLGSRIRRHFLTGVLVVTPALVAGWVLYKFFKWVDGLLWSYLRFGWVHQGGIPGAGLVLVSLFVLLVGLLVNNYIGRRFYGYLDGLLARIPLFNKIYVAIKQMGDALLSGKNRVFRAVALVEFPRPGAWAVVFLTEAPGRPFTDVAGENLRCVFLPTTPNPTTGFLLMVPERNVHRLPITVEEGIKLVISGGAYIPVTGVLAAGSLRRGGKPGEGDSAESD
jgi:uncharacterized membrane protein